MRRKEKVVNMEGGSQFEVAHDKNKIYKRPRRNILMFLYGKADYNQIQKDIRRIKNIFGDYYTETAVQNIGENDFILVQDYIKNGKEIGVSINETIAYELADIVKLNQLLINKHGKSLDFMGNKGNMTGLKDLLTGNFEDLSISNVMVVGEHLKIVDLDLLDLQLGSETQNPIHVIVDNLSYFCSKYFLKKIWNI